MVALRKREHLGILAHCTSLDGHSDCDCSMEETGPCLHCCFCSLGMVVTVWGQVGIFLIGSWKAVFFFHLSLVGFFLISFLAILFCRSVEAQRLEIGLLVCTRKSDKAEHDPSPISQLPSRARGWQVSPLPELVGPSQMLTSLNKPM